MFTMFKIKASCHKGKNFYHKHLSANDYYSEKETVEGKWKGQLAEEFGLKNKEVDAESFSMFQQNINPSTNEKLTKRTREGGVRFYDFQCSAQKSVSIMSLFDERLVDAHRKSVDYAMKEIERFAAVRVRKGVNFATNNFENTGKIVYAQFHHDSSRTLDPQLHAHNVVANVTWDETNGGYKALETLDICKAIRYAGKTYQNKLASECKRLGYETEITRDKKGQITGFELVGISKTENEKFSKRRAQIEEGIKKFKERHGRAPNYEEIATITRLSRDRKMAESSKAEVMEYQKSQFSPERREELENNAQRLKAKGFKLVHVDDEKSIQQLNKAVEIVFEREGVLAEDKVLAEALNQNIGSSKLELLKKNINYIPELVKVTKTEHNPYYSTQTNIEKERFSVQTIDDHKGIYEPLSPNFEPFKEETNFDTSKQGKALKKLLNSKDRFMLMRGVAGAGKTTVLQEFCKGLNTSGIKAKDVQVIAPTNSAVAVLKSEGFDYSETVAKYLRSPNTDKHKVIIIDEAGLNSIGAGSDLIKKSLKNDSRVLFVGDSRQHTSVEAGDFFRIIEKYSKIDKVSLVDIHRQQVKEYNEAIYNCATGDFDSAFNIFDKNMWITEGKSKYLENAAADFIQLTEQGSDLHNTIVVSPTHRECDSLTENIRSKLKEKGILNENGVQSTHFKSFRWTKNQIRAAKNYSPGQEICFIVNLKGFAYAGETAKVKNVKDGYLHLEGGRKLYLKNADSKIDIGETTPIELCKGDVVTFNANYNKRDKIYNGAKAVSTGKKNEFILLNKENKPTKKVTIPANFKAFSYAWVTTSHKSQGRTSKNVIVAAETIDKKAFYVAASRGKYAVKIHCPDKDHLKKHLERRSGDRLAALDLINVESIKPPQKRSQIDFIPAKPVIEGLKPDSRMNSEKRFIHHTAKKATGMSLKMNIINRFKFKNINKTHQRGGINA